MSMNTIILVAAGTVLLLIILAIVLVKRPKKLKVESYKNEWVELQGFCKDKQTWPEALKRADKLLERALKKRKYKGKTMGELMVSAQRVFTDNDSVWFAHNLYKKVLENPDIRLKETDVKQALVGFRQALKDIGALQTGEKNA